MNHLKKRKSIYIPIGLVMILFILLVSHQAVQNRALVPKGLSRSIPVVSDIRGEVYEISKRSDGFDMYANQNGNLTHFIINSQLQTMKSNRIPIEVSPSSKLSVSNGNIYVLNDGKLTVFNGKTTDVLAENVEGIKSDSKQGFYWKGNEVFHLGGNKPILKTDGKIENLAVGDDRSLALSISRDDLTSDCYVFQLTAGKWKETNSFTVSQSSGQFLSDIDFFIQDGNVNVLYTTAQNAKGEIKYRGYFGSYDADEDSAEFEEVNLYARKTKQRLTKNIDYQLVSTDKGPMIVFSGKGMINPKKESWNIYRATRQDGRWLAERVSTPENVATNPHRMGPNEIFWLDNRGKQTQLMAVTDMKPVVAESHSFQIKDWTDGMFDGLTMISYGLIILLFAVLWLAPAFGFLFVVAFWNEEAVEERRKWVHYSFVGVITVIQLMLMQRFFTQSFELFAPDYLTYPLYTVTLPLILIALSLGIVQLVDNGSWNQYGRSGYFAMINLLFIMFLISPYMI